MARKRRKNRPPKPSFRERITEQGRTAASLSRTLVKEPKSFPGQVLALFKRSVRTLWHARGGGLYACGFVVTFISLEVHMMYSEIANANGVGSFLTDQLLEIVFRFSLQSIENTVFAFIWPVFLIQQFQGVGIAILAVLYFVFPRYIKEPLTHWLFDGEVSQEEGVEGAAAAPASKVESSQRPQ